MTTLIKIFGSGRSGTTMLDVMLGNAVDAFSCGEVANWFRPTRTHNFKLETNYPQHGAPCTIWDKLKDVPADQFHATVTRETNANFVIDSSKEFCWVIDTQKWAAENNMKIFNVLLWKDPVDMAYSRWKRGDTDLSRWCKGYVKYYSKVFEVDLPFFAINYNALVNDPPRMLSEICAAIGMPYFAGKERFWEKKHCHLFGSLGIRRQIEAGHSVIKPRKGFPCEFEALIPSLQQEISRDAKLQRILRILKQNDIILSAGNGEAGHQFKIRAIYPWWYYAKRIVTAYRRYRPIEFDPFGGEAVETVPLKPGK